MTLHPAAWLLWLTAVATFAFSVVHPLYLLVACAIVFLVHLAAPPDPSPAGSAVRVFLIVGVTLLVIRLVLVALVSNPGATELFALPRWELPRVLGGFGLGGPVTAEVLVESATDGLRLICVLLAFGVFNARVDLASVIRLVPSAFRDVGLVISIAAAFVPGILRSVRDVRDAQRLRGERGLKMVAPSLAVPIVGLALERAFLLAESMDARGYGRGASPTSARLSTSTGLVCLVVATPLWVAGLGAMASVAAAVGGVALVIGFRTTSHAASTTRLDGSRWMTADVVVGGVCASAAILAIVVGPQVAYSAYPRVRAPDFNLGVAATSALLWAPALPDLLVQRRAVRGGVGA